MKYFVIAWCIFKGVFAAGAPCFTYEVFCHVNPGVPAAGVLPAAAGNAAIGNYDHVLISGNHMAVVGALPATQISFGQFGIAGVAGWGVPALFAGLAIPMNLLNVSRMIARRQAHGVVVDHALLAKLAAAVAAGVVTPALTISLRAGGYFNNLSGLLNSLTLGVFPPGTILGAPLPAFVPNSMIVHVSLPRRVGKNLNELSHSSLSTAVPGGLTLKDRINAPYFLIGLPVPDSATVVSSDHLQ